MLFGIKVFKTWHESKQFEEIKFWRNELKRNSNKSKRALFLNL
jgi:hypothetical protein